MLKEIEEDQKRADKKKQKLPLSQKIEIKKGVRVGQINRKNQQSRHGE